VARLNPTSARAEFPGVVSAPDERTADVAAVAEFNLDEEQRNRLTVGVEADELASWRRDGHVTLCASTYLRTTVGASISASL
jgi:hypothetical protein